MTRNRRFKKFRRPVRVNDDLTQVLRKGLEAYGIEVPGLWKVFVTDTRCGRCAYTSETITVPVWAVVKGEGPDYDIYYACHEIAHALSPTKKGNIHGPEFMEAFKKVCPEELWHYELGYKPRLAAAAGITRKDND